VDGADDRTSRSRRIIELLFDLGLTLKEIASACTRWRKKNGLDKKVSSPHLSRVANGERLASQALASDLEAVLVERVGCLVHLVIERFLPSVELLATDKGGDVPLNSRTSATIRRAFREYLEDSLVGRSHEVRLPRGIFGVLIGLGPLYCILIDERQAGRSRADVLHHELAALARRLGAALGDGAIVNELERLAERMRGGATPPRDGSVATDLIEIGRMLTEMGRGMLPPGDFLD